MTTYRNKTDSTFVEAVQFDPHATWPDGVVSWRNMGYQPRDMSWGCIETVEGRKHIQAWDWVVRGTDGVRLYSDKAFKAAFEVQP